MSNSAKAILYKKEFRKKLQDKRGYRGAIEGPWPPRFEIFG